MAEPAILILGAGASRRMRGRDKLMEEVGGRPLLRRQIEVASATGLDIAVALPPRPHPRWELIHGATGIEVTDAHSGMDASLATGISALANRPAVLVLLGDLPEIESDDLLAVLEARRDHPDYLVWRAVTEDGRPGHPIIFDRTLFPAFANLPGDSGGRSVVAAAGERVLFVPTPGDRARLDLDTPEEWAAWRLSRGEG